MKNLISFLALVSFIFLFNVSSSFSQWSTNGSNVYYNGGNVGIGTSTPNTKLELLGALRLNISSKNYELNYDNGNGYFYIDELGVDRHFVIKNGGNIGLGVPNPQAKLHLIGDIIAGRDEDNLRWILHTRWGQDGEFFQLTMDDENGDWEWTKGLIMNRSTGFFGLGGNTTPIQMLDVNGKINVGSGVIQKGGSAITNTTDLGLYSRTNEWIRIVTNQQPVAFFLDGESNSGKGLYSILRLEKTGTVGQGTATLDGKLIAEEIVVQTVSQWPDYVFEENYDLKKLEEVEEFISREGHLPNIPSADEIEGNGINVGEISSKLLQKIEELTLYVIDQNKRIQNLENENVELKQTLNK